MRWYIALAAVDALGLLGVKSDAVVGALVDIWLNRSQREPTAMQLKAMKALGALGAGGH